MVGGIQGPVIKEDIAILSLSRSREIYVTRYHVRNRSTIMDCAQPEGRHNQGHKDLKYRPHLFLKCILNAIL